MVKHIYAQSFYNTTGYFASTKVFYKRLIPGLLLLFHAPFMAAGALINGKVGTAEAPIGGAMITARALANGIETTVFSQADGTYYIDRLQPGEYSIAVKLSAYSAAVQTLELAEGASTNVNFEALPDPEYRRDLASAHWLSLLPEGPMKREFILNCGSCHEIAHGRVMRDGAPRTDADWAEAIAFMRSIDVYGLTPPDFDDAVYARWLAINLDAAAVQMLQPAAAAAGAVLDARITEYPVPKTPSLPHDITIGPNGRVWVTAFYNNVIWALDPRTGNTQAYPVNQSPEIMGQVRALAFDGDGLLWVLLGGTQSVVRLDPADGAIETFPVGMYPHSIEVDSSGGLWFNDYISAAARIGRIDPSSGQLSLYDIPDAGLTREQGLPLLYGLQVDRNDVVWGTMLAANKLFRFDPRDGEAALFEMPQANSGPRRPGIGPDGSIWIPEFNTGALTRFEPRSRQFTRHELGLTSLGPYDVAVDQRSGHVWVAASLGSALIRFDPASGRHDSFPFPTEPAYPRHIAIDAASGDVWTTYSSMPDATPKIVRIELRTNGRRRPDE